jgi:hypothetical protein
MDYIDYELLRELTGLEDMDDDTIEALALQAIVEINKELNVKVINEEVGYIDQWRKNNYRDGETVTFYPKRVMNNYFGDSNNDGEVDETDITVTKYSTDDVMTTLTVTSIDTTDGSFTLSEAPGTDTKKLLVTYEYSFYDISVPDKVILELINYLTGSYMLFSDEHGLGAGVRFGNISFNSSTSSEGLFYGKYQRLLRRVTIPLNKPLVKQSKYLI